MPEALKQIRILMLDPAGSSWQVTHNLCNALAELGCHIEVFTGPYWARAAASCASRKYAIRVFFSRWTQLRSYEAKSFFSKSFWKVLRFVGHISSMIKLTWLSGKYDVVHVQFLPIPAVDCMFLLLIRRRTKLVYTVHDLIPHDSGVPKFHREFFRTIYAVPSYLFVHSEETRQNLMSEFEVPCNKIIKIRHGSLNHLLQLPVPSKLISRNGKAPILLFLGKIRHDKGLDVLLRAVMLLQQRGIPFHLLVVGHPNINMQPFFKFVKKNNLAKEVEFRLGYIEEADLPGYFSAATIVVLPYREVSQSGVAIGACTFGRAIIATKIGGLKEMVDEAKNGLLVSVDDPFELATALEDLLASESLRREFEQNSKRYSNEALSWSEIAALTANSYRSLSESTRLLDSQN